MEGGALFLLLIALLMTAGCAGMEESAGPGAAEEPQAGISQDTEYSVARQPVKSKTDALQAFVTDDHFLQLQYRKEGTEIWSSVKLPEETLPSKYYDLPVHLIPDLPVVEVADGTQARFTWSPGTPGATILSPSDWAALIYELSRDVTPGKSNHGVILDILRQEELFLYRNEAGEILSVPVLFKPENMEAVDLISLTAVLVEGAAHVRKQLADMQISSSYVLYNTGDYLVKGYPFVFMDLDSGAVHYIRLKGAASPVVTGSPLNIVPASAAALAGQLKSYIGQPIRSVTRLVTSVGTTAVDTFTPTPQWLLENTPVPPVSNNPGMNLQEWEEQLDTILGSPATYGQLRFLIDGESFFPRLIEAINRARKSLLMRLYIFDNDDYAVKIADFLKKRSNDISIKILLDGLGTVGAAYAEPAYMPENSRGWRGSITAYLREQSNINLRVVANPWLQGDHTKTIIVDGDTVFLGGMNIGREYRYEWHDMMVEATGPITEHIIRDFKSAWKQAGVVGDIQALIPTALEEQKSVRSDHYPVRVLYTKPGNSQILRAQVAAMRQARQRIWIENAYITSDAILYELLKARKRGIDVRVILPFENDSGIIDRSNVLAANLLLRHGVRVYIYPGMSHIKAAIYDGWSCLGSANFDRLSLRLNKEMNLATSHAPVVEELIRTVFNPDFERSVELTEPLPKYWHDYLMELIADQL